MEGDLRTEGRVAHSDIATAAITLKIMPSAKEIEFAPVLPTAPLVAALAIWTFKKPAPHRSVIKSRTSAIVSVKLGP